MSGAVTISFAVCDLRHVTFVGPSQKHRKRQRDPVAARGGSGVGGKCPGRQREGAPKEGGKFFYFIELVKGATEA
jgi:hypothetical protein